MWLRSHRWASCALALVTATIIAVFMYGLVDARAPGSPRGEQALLDVGDPKTPGAIGAHGVRRSGMAWLPVSADTAMTDLPDLEPEHPWYLEDRSDPCALTWVVGVTFYVRNQGQADAGPFEFTVNSTPYVVSSGLPAGQTYQLAVDQWPWSLLPNGRYDIVVDPLEQVAESNEGNNTLNGMLPMITPRPSCTPTTGPSLTATATASPSPTATAGPSPTATATGRWIRLPIVLTGHHR